MSKKCLFCGAELEDNAVFCDECGRKQEKNTADESKSQPEKEQVTQNQENEERKKAQAYHAWVSLIVGVISIVLIFVFPFVSLPISIIGIVLGIKGIKSSKKAFSVVGSVINVAAAGFVLSALIAGILGL